MKIWKYDLKVTDAQSIRMPVGARVLCVQVQRSIPRLWVAVDPDEKLHSVRRFYTFGTGNQEVTGLYVGTYQLNGGDLVFHVFEAA